MVAHYVRNKQVMTVQITESGSSFARHIDPLRGETINPGEIVGVQFWQGEEAGNFFLMRSAVDVLAMLAMAAKAGSSYEWMGCDAKQMGVPI